MNTSIASAPQRTQPSGRLGSISTSGDSDSDSAPPETQPQTKRGCVDSTTVRAPHSTPPRVNSATARAPPPTSAARDSDDDRALPTTQPWTVLPAPRESTQPTLPVVNSSRAQDPRGHGPSKFKSNKENSTENIIVIWADESISLRLAARQSLPRRNVPVFGSLARSSSPSSSSSSSSSSEEPELANRPPVDPLSSSGNMGDGTDASEVFSDPFRFEVVPELAKNTNPDIPKRYWVLTVKIWYKGSLLLKRFDPISNFIVSRIICHQAQR